jgi:uncharacterized protein YaaR (DUF327 family)
MEIRVNKTSYISPNYKVPEPGAKTDAGFSQSFQQNMQNQQKQDLHKRVKELLDDFQESAENICRKTDMGQFQDYCNKLGDILSEILSNAYLFQGEKVKDGFGRQRIFATIAIVDEKLKTIGDDLVTGNSTQLEFLSRIDEIRGLITDLFS